MELLMARPSNGELVDAVAYCPPSRLSQQSHFAKERHTKAMRAIVMGTPGLPRGFSLSQQRGSTLRDFIHSVPELAATAESISTKNLEAVAVAAQISEIPAPHVRAPSRRLRRPPLPPMPPLKMRRPLVPGIGSSTRPEDPARSFVFLPSKHAGASVRRPLLITDDNDDMPQPGDVLAPGERVRYPLRSQSTSSPTQHFIITNTAHVSQPPYSTTLVPYRAPEHEPVSLPGTCGNLAIKIDSEDDGQSQRDQGEQSSSSMPPPQQSIVGTAAQTNEQGDQSRQDLRWQYSGPTLPLQRLVPVPGPSVRPLTKRERKATDRAARPLTKKERKAAGKSAAPPAKVHKTQSKKQKVQQELKGLRKQLDQKKKQETNVPHISAGSWKATVGSQVSQVRQHFFARAKNEMHTRRRSYPIVIEALEGVIADLKTEASLYQGAQRAPPVLPTLQPSQAPSAPSAPPVSAVSTRQPEEETTIERKFWKLPVRFVAAGMTALKNHMDHVDASNMHSTVQSQDVNGDIRWG